MTAAATESAIDAAYWFFQRAEKDNRFIDDKKIHHLLFIAQKEFVKKIHGSVLLPSLFVCDENGFTEPNLAKIFSFGRPFMPPVVLEDKLTVFLEGIWKKHASAPTADLEELVKSGTLYQKYFKHGEKTLISPEMIVETAFDDKKAKTDKKKILFSQNGPVVVSQWNPRKL